MPTTKQLRLRLIDKLKELFQLNQPDLDFGFYRIMHAKSEQVTRFLEDDLLAIIADAFGEVDDTRKAQLKAEYEKEVETAKEYGAADPETVPKVKEARERYETAQDTATAEGEIYDHLYRFFERYYDNGDFISRRYYTRETPGKAAPFAVPYNGEEVKLHWANADQYYIKTAEHFRNFTVDLRQAKEIRELAEADELGLEIGDDNPRLVHFRIVDATEGEHGNVKASEASKRYFIIHKDEPVKFVPDEGLPAVASAKAGELVIQFEYRPDPEKSGQENTWRDKRNAEAVEVVLAAMASLSNADEYRRLITVPAPTDKDAKRPLLAKYINQYTARNTMDYFIHKDLGAFLRRELDFYIKNEVMRLDDIESAEAPAVETYLSKLKVLRTIAHKLIDFLAQLEDFQKRLWLKKKFVVETNYCITLDRIPEALYPEIAASDAQREEWVRLFAIDGQEASTTCPAYSAPLSADFLKAMPSLVLDTAFFSRDFCERLLGNLDSLEATCEGLAIHSDNYQALNLLHASCSKQQQTIYIDPPYNTDAGPILYKNGYRSASWVTLIADRLHRAKALLADDGILCVTIDDYQLKELLHLVEQIFGSANILGVVAIRINPSGRITLNGFGQAHEYAIFAGATPHVCIGKMKRTEAQEQRYGLSDGNGAFEWRNFRREGSSSERRSRPRRFYPIYVAGEKLRVPTMAWDENTRSYVDIAPPQEGEEVVYPIDSTGGERVWRWGRDRVQREIEELSARQNNRGILNVYYKYRPNAEGVLPLTVWFDKKYSATEYGTAVLKNLFGERNVFSFPKSIHAVEDCLDISGMRDEEARCLDFFAGSGTTAHAVLNLNRGDDGARGYILVESESYFDDTLRPRVAKAMFSRDWKDGKPLDPSTGISHAYKYIRLESYEDCLNNLVFAEGGTRDRTIERSDALREDYMLHYMLDVETRGSQSLLNIDAFADPTAYTLRVKKPGSDQYGTRNVDLIETFNYLIGLRVTHIAAPQSFTAKFKRETDPELPEDTQTRLVVDGRLTQDEKGPWWFRKVEGWVPADPNNPNNGERQKVLIVWRKLTGQIEEDNLMLDEWFQRNRISTRDFEFDVIYVNGSNNLPNLKQEGDNWKVRLIEEDFMRLMWDVEDV